MYKIQVKVKTGINEYEWRYLKPTNGADYEYKTEPEAQRVRDMCYPDSDNKTVRVVSI